MEEKVFFNGDKYLKIKNKDVGNGDVVYIKKIDGEKLFPPNLRKVSLIHGNEVVFEGNDIKNLNSLLLNSNTDEFETFRIASEVQSEKEQSHTNHEVDTISTNAINGVLSDTKWKIPIDNVAQDISNTTTTSGGGTSNNFNYQEEGDAIGRLVDEKQAAYGDAITKTSELLKVFLRDYKNHDGTYTIPEELLNHIAIQVRIMDKQNRIFSNPKGDLMSESPYRDLAGYGLLGSKIINK